MWNTLPTHETLLHNSRLSSLLPTQQRTAAFELSALLLAGFASASASVFLHLRLGIPGSSIVRTVFPMALGLALAPRRGAGCVMGASALASVVLFRVGGFGLLGVGATTSLFLTGPLLDLALWRPKRGVRLYFCFALAGLAANLGALTIRGGVKLFGFDHATGRTLAMWFPQAVVTYALCGLLAGLLSAVVWFRFASRHPAADGPEDPQ